MKRCFIYILFLLCFIPIYANDFEEEIIPQNDWVIRVNAGSAFPNRVGTGESSWYSNLDESSCGFQYGVDLIHYNKCIGYGFTFKHYMHNLPYIENQGLSIDEKTRILYVAPQFSNIDEDFLFKGMVSNIDLGIGYAHYLSDGIINASQNYSAPCSGLSINLNLGLEYKFNVNWGVKISISGEYYHFKDIHKDNEYSVETFDKRSKLNMLMVIPQIGISVHL